MNILRTGSRRAASWRQAGRKGSAERVRGIPLRPGVLALAAIASSVAGHSAWAFSIDTGNPDVRLRWDNTVKYSAAWRVKKPSGTLTNSPPSTVNQDDGDRNFDRGLISSRLDLFSEMDLVYRGFGARISGAAWYDDVYNRSNDNDSPTTANAYSVPYDRFPGEAEKLHGGNSEVLDAFVFGGVDIGESRATFRLGKHALLWGESLFFGANGIAGGQAPVDVVRVLSVPNTTFKELIRPVQQLSAQLQINADVSVGAYYQFRWEKNRFPAAGSYFSTLDIFDDGDERLIMGAPLVPGGGPAAFFEGRDIEAKDWGQGGVQVRFRVGETDYGLYAIRYHDKSPSLYFVPGVGVNPLTGQIGEYRKVYAEGIRAFGASFSHTFDNFNVAGEISTRRNTPLASDPQVDVSGTADNSHRPLYAVGNSLHAQVSWIGTLGHSFIADEADFIGEIAWNRRLGVTKNRSALTPNADEDAVNLRLLYEPKYRQALPGVDLSVPIGLGYGIGNSSVVGAFYGDRVGDVNIGINATYLQAWRFGLSYTHFFGPEGTLINDANHASYQQALKDRDFISLSIRRTF